MNAEIVQPDEAGIQQAAKLIREGQVVGMPTETVYGLAGSLFNEGALARIFSVKKRPTFDPLIAHVAWEIPPLSYLTALSEAGVIDLTSLSIEAQTRAEKLLQAFWPGPFTLILPKAAGVPDLATSGLPAVAVRAPRHPVAQKLIIAAGTPLSAPSANRFGRISPTEAEHVREELGDLIPLILDGGPCEVGVESTVVAVEPQGGLKLLRPGGTPRSEIERVAGVPAIPVLPTSKPSQSELIPDAQVSPGMLASHYAPSKPLVLLPTPLDSLMSASGLAIAQSLALSSDARVGFLAQTGDAELQAGEFHRRFGVRPCEIRVLSPAGSLLESTRNLFRFLRELDSSSADLLVAEPMLDDPDGLGHAIQDRLSRAAVRR